MSGDIFLISIVFGLAVSCILNILELENSKKVILTAVVIMLAILLITLGINTFKNSMQSADSTNAQITLMNQTINELIELID